MSYRLIRQMLASTGLYCLLGMVGIAAAASSNWVTKNMLLGGKLPVPCAKDNPYCAANVPAPPKPSAQFDPSQVPCDSANAECAKAYSQQMTENYQAGVAFIPPPYVPCAMEDGCVSVPPWWDKTVKQPIQQKTIPYDPGARPWTQQKSCGTQFVGGVYMDNPCPTNSQ